MFEQRLREEWAAREADWDVKRTQLVDIKNAWDSALVWWAHLNYTNLVPNLRGGVTLVSHLYTVALQAG
jgi:hypothetical protein